MMLLRSRGDDPVSSDVVDARPRDPRRHGCEAFQFGQRRRERFTERFNEPASDRGGRFHGHLLPENRAQPELESVEGARHAQAGIRLDRRGQARIFAETLRDHIRARVEIEERSHTAEECRQHWRQAVRELHQQRVLLLRLRDADPALRLSELNGPRVRACP